MLGRVAVLVTTLLACTSLATSPATAADPDVLDVRLLAFNDFRGNLTPPQGKAGVIGQADGSSVPAGGAAYLAAYVSQLRSQASNSLLYSVGDNWGSAALESSMFHDEPVVDLLNTMGVTASGIGNLELDGGFQELQRLQHGGCHPVDGCQFQPKFAGAAFPMLAANLTYANGVPATLPFNVNFVDEVPIGVIGVLPKDTGKIVPPDRAAGLAFGDELDAINRTADLLDFFGVKAIAVLLHEAEGSAPDGPDACNQPASAARTVAESANPKVDVIFTAGGNRQYNCNVNDPEGKPRVFMQGASNGRVLSVVDVNIDRNTRDVLRDRTSSFNQIVTRDISPDLETAVLVESAKSKAAAVAQRVVGSISTDITRDTSPSGESPLGNLVADAQLAATAPAGAQLALTNAGGIRADLNKISSRTQDQVTYGDAYAVQPFGNPLRVLTMSGAQIKDALEQQFQLRDSGNVWHEILAPSANVRYEIHDAAPLGQRIAGLSVGGVPIDPAATYRVAVNKFLADGGDGFAAFTHGLDGTDAGRDIEALTDYLASHGPLGAPATDRIVRIG